MPRAKRPLTVLFALGLLLVPSLACVPKPSTTPTPPPLPTAVPTFTSIPTPRPSPGGATGDLPEGLAILSHQDFTDRGGARHVVGEVYNNGPAPYRWCKVTATFYDVDGNPLATEENRVYVDTLLPGEKAPFKLSLWNPPTGIEAYAIATSGSETTEQPFTGIEFVQERAAMDGHTLAIIGEVINSGELPASQVQVAAAVYDADGAILDAGYTYAHRHVFEGGARSPFRLSIPDIYHGTPDRYELIAYGGPATDGDLDAQAVVVVTEVRDARGREGLVIVGEVTNDGDKNAAHVVAFASFYDDQHQLVAVGKSRAWASILSPGTRSPFGIGLPDPPAEIAHWSVWAQGEATAEQPPGQLVIASSDNWVDEQNVATFRGRVRNDGDETMSYIEVAVSVYDPQARFLTAGWTHIVGDLSPGAMAPYEITLATSDLASSFEIAVQGRPKIG